MKLLIYRTHFVLLFILLFALISLPLLEAKARTSDQRTKKVSSIDLTSQVQWECGEYLFQGRVKYFNKAFYLEILPPLNSEFPKMRGNRKLLLKFKNYKDKDSIEILNDMDIQIKGEVFTIKKSQTTSIILKEITGIISPVSSLKPERAVVLINKKKCSV